MENKCLITKLPFSTKGSNLKFGEWKVRIGDTGPRLFKSAKPLTIKAVDGAYFVKDDFKINELNVDIQATVNQLIGPGNLIISNKYAFKGAANGVPFECDCKDLKFLQGLDLTCVLPNGGYFYEMLPDNEKSKFTLLFLGKYVKVNTKDFLRNNFDADAIKEVFIRDYSEINGSVEDFKVFKNTKTIRCANLKNIVGKVESLANMPNLKYLSFQGSSVNKIKWNSPTLRNQAYPILTIMFSMEFDTPVDTDNYLINMSNCKKLDNYEYKILIRGNRTANSNMAIKELRNKGLQVYLNNNLLTGEEIL